MVLVTLDKILPSVIQLCDYWYAQFLLIYQVCVVGEVTAFSWEQLGGIWKEGCQSCFISCWEIPGLLWLMMRRSQQCQHRGAFTTFSQFWGSVKEMWRLSQGGDSKHQLPAVVPLISSVMPPSPECSLTAWDINICHYFNNHFPCCGRSSWLQQTDVSILVTVYSTPIKLNTISSSGTSRCKIT